ncbi:hypothetical protein MTO96_049059 [Rhipicephalus appendiculatus]
MAATSAFMSPYIDQLLDRTAGTMGIRISRIQRTFGSVLCDTAALKSFASELRETREATAFSKKRRRAEIDARSRAWDLPLAVIA